MSWFYAGRCRPTCRPSSRIGENPPYGMIGRVEETSASFEARSAPRSYPTRGLPDGLLHCGIWAPLPEAFTSELGQRVTLPDGLPRSASIDCGLSGAGVLERHYRGASQRRGPAKSRWKVVITVLDNVRGGAPRRGRTRISGGFNARLVGGEPTWPRQRADTKLPSTVACRADTWLQDGFPPNLSWSSPHRCQAPRAVPDLAPL